MHENRAKIKAKSGSDAKSPEKRRDFQVRALTPPPPALTFAVTIRHGFPYFSREAAHGQGQRGRWRQGEVDDEEPDLRRGRASERVQSVRRQEVLRRPG